MGFAVSPQLHDDFTWHSINDHLILCNSQACSDDAVHPGIMKGIYGRREDGARSVALSGGYEDDEDNGDTLYVNKSERHLVLLIYHFSNSTYTGSGGRDLSSGRLGKKVGQRAWNSLWMTEIWSTAQDGTSSL